MDREQLLKLGTPAGRMTTAESGHLIETYDYYSSNGVRIGTVRLSDGIVSKVQIP